MNLKNLFLTACISFTSFITSAQDLTSKIPAQSQIVVTFNNEGISKNNSEDLFNEIFLKLRGNIDAVNPSDKSFQSIVNLQKPAYYYLTYNDSVRYSGFLISLKENHQIDSFLKEDYKELPAIGNYHRRTTNDGSMQMAFNDNSLLILTGEVVDEYFLSEDIANQYGIELAANDNYNWDYLYEEDTAFEATETTDYTDTLNYDNTAVYEQDVTLLAENFYTEDNSEYIEVTSEEYSILTDEAGEITEASEEDFNWYSHLLSPEQEAKNDSIKKEVFSTWISHDFADYLNPKEHLGKNRSLKIKDSNHLIRLWVPNLDNLYSMLIPTDVISMVYSFKIENFKYGYEEALFDIIQDQNQLKFVSNVSVDKELATQLKNITKSKFNKQLTKYIPESYIAYSSLNISTEHYLEELPKFITRWYMPIVKDEFFEVMAMALEISLDEKAIGKIFRGDNLLVIKDIRKVNREYTTYDYDEDYNYEEVIETKEEYVPDYLWVFTAEDQRLYRKIFDYAVSKEKMVAEDGFYTVLPSYNSEGFHILLKGNMVFVSSNEDDIKAIKENRFKNTINSKARKNLMNNPFNLKIEISKIPEITSKMEIPVSFTSDKTIEKLADLGPIEIKIDKLKNNTIHSTMSVDLPKANKNVVRYLFQVLFNDSNAESVNDL